MVHKIENGLFEFNYGVIQMISIKRFEANPVKTSPDLPIAEKKVIWQQPDNFFIHKLNVPKQLRYL